MAFGLSPAYPLPPASILWSGLLEEGQLGFDPSFLKFYQLGDISKFLKTLSFGFLVRKQGKNNSIYPGVGGGP